MKLLKEITDADIGGKNDSTIKYRLRKATRAVLFREDGKIALLYVGNHQYYKLPRGGVDEGEDIKVGLKREVIEEVGCDCTLGDEIGVVIEYRNEKNLLQINYCYKAITTAIEFLPEFTQNEIDDGFKLQRSTLEEAKELLKVNLPDTYDGKFINIRDRCILDNV